MVVSQVIGIARVIVVAGSVMSKRRLVITAVLAGASQSEVARTYGVSHGWIGRLMARYRLEGEAAFEPQSRRPKTLPHATVPTVVDLVLKLRTELTDAGLDGGDHRVAPGPPSRPHRVAGHCPPDPGPPWCGGPGSGQAAQVLVSALRSRDAQRVLAVRLHPLPPHPTRRRPGADTEIITWLDDHSRYVLHLSAHSRVTAQIVLATFRTSGDPHRYPASALTDNGMATPSGWPATAAEAAAPPWRQSYGDAGSPRRTPDPATPPPAGLAERFQQTLKKWLRAQPQQPATIAELQALLDRFGEEYNRRRPHRSLPHRATPATIYAARPKATPDPASRTTDTHDRVRTDIIDMSGTVTLRVAGRLRHIGIGRTPQGNPRHQARTRPLGPDHQRHHRRDPPRADHRPRHRLPATIGRNDKARTHGTWVRDMPMS